MVDRLTVLYYYSEDLEDDLNEVKRGETGFYYYDWRGNRPEIDDIKQILFDPNKVDLQWKSMVDSYVGHYVRVSKKVDLISEIKYYLHGRLDELKRLNEFDIDHFNQRRVSKNPVYSFVKRRLYGFSEYLELLNQRVSSGELELIFIYDWIKIDKSIYFRKEKEYGIEETKVSLNANFKLSDKRGKKIDLIRILTAMYDLKFFVTGDDDLTPPKKDVMNAFGHLLNVDLSDYDKHFGQAIEKGKVEPNIEVFSKLSEKISKKCIDKLSEKK